MDETIAREAFGGRDLLFDPELVNEPDRLLAEIGPARALIVRNRTQVRGALLEAAENLKVVGRLGVGLENIDMEACRDKGVAVRPATGANVTSVAEYVVTAALILLRGAWTSSQQVVDGKWPRNALIGGEVSGKVLGLVGFGAIAQAAAKRAQALGMSVLAHDPFLAPDHAAWTNATSASLDKILIASDVISLHTPLTDQTRGMIGSFAFAKMKDTAVVINTARGGVIDEDALVAALKDGHIAGAALDVFADEPMTSQIGEKFAGLPNVILTPHIAGVTTESNLRVSAVTVANVLEVLNQN